MPSPATPVPRGALPSAVPVVARPDGRFQVGSAPRSAVVLRTPPVVAGPWGGPGRPAHPGAEEGRAWSVYDRSGPDPAERMALRAQAGVAVVGSPRTADVLLQLLADAGVGRLLCERPQAVPAGTRTAGRPGDPGAADVVVLLDEHSARPVLADGLVADGVAHLSVVLRDTDALVGPMVLPGRSACLRCVDRWRTDADPVWPAVRDALSRTAPRPTDAATAATVAGVAALQVLSHLDGALPAALGCTLELLLPEGRVRRRGWGPHPGCGCVELPVP
ncbi:hypothetical protein [Kineococcus radiotolerans]|uniref:UBA/THIF-type NAD/FAD binding protein n=1 Tax=Kineococcus radiotolerans (strain ATCC BAA-149 / DSM 14245 / SRS30216) TaxID=266940 RepID=A6W782_KINRD|nr:hypothetical protein [Kineococcus radiotolerans]ABS02671.1 hypothetical protein Krad_1183 [Kineococcus radiotolerans SRS30216 = ATCC BAA-149]